MTEKATARAHPIQGLVKYHGMRDPELRLPYHDSISLCTAPTATTTTVEWQPDASEDVYVIGDEEVDGRAAERIDMVVEHVRELAGVDAAVRLESENSFPSNIGFGSSSSGFAAAALALTEAAGLDLTLPDISTVARRGSSSAARSVTGAYSRLDAGLNDEDCRSHRLDVGVGDDGFDPEEDLRIVAAHVPAYKETEEAHREAAASHMMQARTAHVQDQLVEMTDALREGDFDRICGTAEHDSLSPTATTMTGPAGGCTGSRRRSPCSTRSANSARRAFPSTSRPIRAPQCTSTRWPATPRKSKSGSPRSVSTPTSGRSAVRRTCSTRTRRCFKRIGVTEIGSAPRDAVLQRAHHSGTLSTPNG